MVIQVFLILVVTLKHIPAFIKIQLQKFKFPAIVVGWSSKKDPHHFFLDVQKE